MSTSHGQGTHRVPWRQDRRLFTQDSSQALRKIVPADSDLVHVLVEPRVCHDVESLIPKLVSPRILDTPLARVPIAVEVDTRQHHGLRHGTLSIQDALSLVTDEPLAVDEVIFKDRRVQDTEVLLFELAHVAAEPYGPAGDQHIDRGLLENLDGGVQVPDTLRLDDIAQVADRVQMVHGFVGRRTVDEADLVLEVHADVPPKKLLWRDGTVTVEDASLVPPLPEELDRRCTEMNGEHAKDHAHHHLLARAQDILFIPGASHPPQFSGILPQLGRDDGVHDRRVAAALRLGHDGLRDDAVLGHECAEHVPRAAILHGMMQQIHQQAPIQGLRQRGGDTLKEVAGLLQLVPEHEVVLGQLELVDIK